MTSTQSSRTDRSLLPRAAKVTSLCISGYAAAGLLACSSQDSLDVGTLVDESSESSLEERGGPLSGDEQEAEFQRQFTASLSDDERIAVENLLRESGIDMTEAAFSGRVVTFGDAYLSVDALLAERNTIEKGRVLNATVSGNGTDNLPKAPVVYFSTTNGRYFFHRPYYDGAVIVVPDGSAASFLVGAFQQAAAAIASSVAGDCLVNAIPVETQAQWSARPVLDLLGKYPVFVRYGAHNTVCPGSDLSIPACSLFPRFGGFLSDIGLPQTRMVIGPRIGVSISEVTSEQGADAKNVGLLTHELLHTLGLSHSDIASGSLVAPGTDGSTAVESVMHSNAFCCQHPGDVCPPSPGCLWRSTITADDHRTIRALYFPPPGTSCAYSPTPLQISGGCVAVSSSDLRGESCWCEDELRSFKRALWNANTYLCQW
jgi:hypothetical protein